jgi:hypothetical protein
MYEQLAIGSITTIPILRVTVNILPDDGHKEPKHVVK